MDIPRLPRLGSLVLPNWKYNPAESRRDLRLDFLRGVFLVCMICYHFQRAWVIRFTYEFLGNVSNAEGFVFVSGMVVGLVYLPLVKTQGVRAMTKRVGRRALHLYLAAVITLGILVLTSAWLFRLKGLNYVRQHPLAEVLWNVVTLRYIPFGFDILLLYIGLLIITPLVLWLIYKGHTRWVILFSITAFAAYRFFPDVFTLSFANKDQAHFPIMLWQVVFLAGILASAHREQLKQFWHNLSPIRPALVVALLFVAFFMLRQLVVLDLIPFSDKEYNYWFGKSWLGVGRLINGVVIAIVFYWFITNFWQPLYRAFGKIFIPLGQASLYVFIVHLFLAYLYRTVSSQLPLTNTGIYELVTIVFIWFLVKQRFLFQYVPH